MGLTGGFLDYCEAVKKDKGLKRCLFTVSMRWDKKGRCKSSVETTEYLTTKGKIYAFFSEIKSLFGIFAKVLRMETV